MTVFGPGKWLELLEEEFKSMYPVFTRRFDFFQMKQALEEDPSDCLNKLAALSDMADLESMNKEDLTVFQFMSSCQFKRLKEKLFDIKRTGRL